MIPTPVALSMESCRSELFGPGFCWVGTHRWPFPLLDLPLSHYHFAHRNSKKSCDTLEGRSWMTSAVSNSSGNLANRNTATLSPCVLSSWSDVLYPTSLANSVLPTARYAISSVSSAPAARPVKCPPFRCTCARTTPRRQRQRRRTASRNPRRRRLPHAGADR